MGTSHSYMRSREREQAGDNREFGAAGAHKGKPGIQQAAKKARNREVNIVLDKPGGDCRENTGALFRSEGMVDLNKSPQLVPSFRSERYRAVLNGAEDFPIDIEEEVFSFFESVLRKAFSGGQSQWLNELKRLKKSPVERDQKIFTCMARRLVECNYRRPYSCFQDFAIDIEAHVSSYFENLHAGHLTVEDLLNLLKQLRKSSVQTEQKLFACMVKCVFDDYKFFPRYLESNSRITAVLLGSLAKHRLLTLSQFNHVLNLVGNALEQSDSKIFSLGMVTLEQIMDLLVIWPKCCENFSRILKSREARGETQGEVAQMDTHRATFEFLDHVVAQWSQGASGVSMGSGLSSIELRKVLESEISMINEVHDPVYSSSAPKIFFYI